MSVFRFYLDNGLIEEPKGWDQMKYAVTRDLDNNFIYSRIVGELVFSGAAYSYLNGIRVNNSFCYSSELLIQIKCAPTDEFVNYFQTKIYISKCEFNTFRCEVSAPISDDGWATQIQKNKKIEAYVNTNKTKNLFDITPIDKYNCIVFSPYTGINYPLLVWGFFRAYDVLKNYVAFMSDNIITFSSTFFDSGDGAGLYFTTGQNLRTFTLDSNTIFPGKTSFEKLYQFLMGKYNIGMGLKNINGQIILEIEESSYFYNNNSNFTLEYIRDEIRFFKEERLFSSVTLGNQIFLEQAQCDNGNGICTFPQFDLKMFAQENFGILGDCNVDRKLEIQAINQITCDANVIEDCVRFQNTSHDQTIIAIECEVVGALQLAALKTNFGSPITYVYNYNLRNEACAARWLDNGICGSLSSYYLNYDADEQVWDIDTNILCFADWCGGVFNTYLNVGVVKFDNPVTNPSVLYDATTGRATVQMPGVYFISAQCHMVARTDQEPFCRDNINSVDFAIKAKAYLRIYDASGNLIYSLESNEFDHTSFFQIQPADNAFLTMPLGSYLMDSGYYAQVELYLFQYDLSGTPDPSDDGLSIVVYDSTESYFTCHLAEPIQSGEFGNTPENCKVEAAKFEKFLSFGQLQLLMSNPSKAIDYTIGINNEPTRTGFISESETNLKTLKTEFELFIV